MSTIISIEELPLRENLESSDNIIVESLENPDVPTSRTTIEEVKKLFTGQVTEESNGFIKGQEIHQHLETLKSAANNICPWTQSLMDLCIMPLAEFVELKCDCCLVLCSIPDFPQDLIDSDAEAYVFTNRNEEHAVQMLVGATTGTIATRSMNKFVLTEWDYSSSKGISYATFSIRNRHLIMHTDPGYSGANFSIRNHHLIVTI